MKNRDQDRAKNRQAQARWRARKRKNLASYRCDASHKVLSMLVRRRYLAEDEVGDDREVGRAITIFLIDHAEFDDE